MRLMATKNIYFVPFGQDAPEKKPNSMVARMELLEDTVLEALQGKQLQPVVVEKIQIYELKNEKKRTIFDETIILTVEYDKINVIKIRRGILYSFSF